jgi:hypothetical protein
MYLSPALHLACLRFMLNHWHGGQQAPLPAPEPQTITVMQNVSDIASMQETAKELKRRSANVERAVNALLKEAARMHETQQMGADLWQRVADMHQTQVNATVYLLRCTSGGYKGYYKIGMTGRDGIEKRVAEIEDKYKGTWEVVKTIDTDDGRLEKSIQRTLKYSKANIAHARELFVLADELVALFLRLPHYLRYDEFTEGMLSTVIQKSIFD